MREFVILTDSTSDLNSEIRKQYNIDYVQMNVVYDDKEFAASLDWEVYSPKEFYDLIRAGKNVKTTQVPYASYSKVFDAYAKEGKDIIYIACSSALSGSIHIARTAKDEILDTYPDIKIECIDALNSSLGQGMMVIDAAIMRHDGKSFDEVVDYIENNKLKYRQVATVGDLKYLQRAGRIKSSSAFFGNLFNVKPIIISDIVGQNYAFTKVRGRKESLSYLVEHMKKTIIDPENQVIWISHADCVQDAEMLKQLINKVMKVKDVKFAFFGPIVGASVGPGTIGLYYKGEEETIKGE